MTKTATIPTRVTAALNAIGVVNAGYRGGHRITVASEAAAEVANRIHARYAAVRNALDEVAKTAERAAEMLDLGNNSYDVMWVESAAEKLAAAKLELTTLVEIGSLLLSVDELTVAHSSATVRFAVADAA